MGEKTHLHVTEKLNLKRSLGGELSVAALAGVSDVLRPCPRQERLPEPLFGVKQRDRAVRPDLPVLQHELIKIIITTK